MKKTIHVHVHEQTAPTRDSDDGEGRWVTIMGAHVHIGKGGKIDKGPAALVGKGEHQGHAHAHRQEAEKHTEAAVGKGKEHPDTKHHYEAASAHREAAMRHDVAHHLAESGEIKMARKEHATAEKHAAAAKEHASKVAPKDNKPFDMPASHQGLHSDAADDVKGSAKHAAEHNRLLNLYHTSNQDWERNAVNRQIQNNATAAVQQKAQSLHHTAMAASEFAKHSVKPEDHAIAMQHIQSAIDAHGKAGGVGYAAKQAELEKMKKPHAKIVGDANKSLAKAGAPGRYGVDHDKHLSTHDEAKAEADVKARRADLEAKGFKHEKSEGGREQLGGVKHHYGHADGSRAVVIHQHHTGAENKHTVSSTVNTMNQGKKPSKAQQEREAREYLSKKRASGGYDSKSGNGLDEIAKRAAKRAAENAADQDPKHKQ